MELYLRLDLTRRFPSGTCGVIRLRGWFPKLCLIETNTLVLSKIDLEHFFKGPKFNRIFDCVAGRLGYQSRLAAADGGRWLLTATGGVDGYEGSN